MIVDCDCQPLLGLSDCIKFKIIRQIHSVVKETMLTKDKLLNVYKMCLRE